MRIIFWFFFFSIVYTVNAKLCTSFPENDQYYSEFPFAPIAETEFEKSMAEARAIYTPLAKAEGATLTIQGNWSDGTVNAWAQKSGSQWTVQMFGGMARHPKIGQYGFQTVLCHELGHLFGAAPLYSGQKMAVEGQADYFSTSKCIRKLYRGVTSPSVPSEASNLCAKYWSSANDRDLCELGMEGGISLGNVLASLSNSASPSLTKEDPKVVSSTQESHPQAQCRLDSYKRGSLCGVSETVDFSYTDHKKGACLDSVLQRPLCWYKPNYTTDPDPCDDCEPDDDIPPTPSITRVFGKGFKFKYDSLDYCEFVVFEIKKGVFTQENSEFEDVGSYLRLTTEEQNEEFIVPSRYFKRGTNYGRYHCLDGGPASDSVRFVRR